MALALIHWVKQPQASLGASFPEQVRTVGRAQSCNPGRAWAQGVQLCRQGRGVLASEGTQALPGQPAAPSETVGDVTMPCLPLLHLLPAWQEGARGRPQLLSGTLEEAWGMCH